MSYVYVTMLFLYLYIYLYYLCISEAISRFYATPPCESIIGEEHPRLISHFYCDVANMNELNNESE